MELSRLVDDVTADTPSPEDLTAMAMKRLEAEGLLPPCPE